MKKSIALSVTSIETLKTLKYHILLTKRYLFLLFVISVAVIMKIFREEGSIEILKILGLVKTMKG